MYMELHRHPRWPIPTAADHGGIFGWGSSWGTWPQWLTWLTALIIGGFTIWGIITARKSYKDSVWQTKVRVARLVYCDAPSSARLPVQVGGLGFHSDKFKDKFGLGYFAENGRAGYSMWTAKRDLFGFEVVVANNSDEPVSDVLVQVLDPFEHKAFKSDGPMRVGILPPRTTWTYAVYLPVSVNREVENPGTRVRLLFTDSAGSTWSRIESEPPEPDNSYDYSMLAIGLDQAHLYEPSMFD